MKIELSNTLKNRRNSTIDWLCRFEDYVDAGHINKNIITVQKSRHLLKKALCLLGKDAALTADIVIRNITLRNAEFKYKIRRGKAKDILRKSLDNLGELFNTIKN